MNDFIEQLWRARATAILRCADQRLAADAMAAAVRGGFQVVEFTLTVPGAFELIQDFAARPGLVVGAGTVLTREQARRAVAAGARFLVSPVTDEEVIREATALGVASMPGTHTASEMWRAHQAGAPLVKLFPAPAGGPSYLRSLLGPMPFLRVVPTNGVDPDNARAWLDAGAFAVGLVASLFRPDDLAAGRLDRIEERARAACASIAGATRAASPPTFSEPLAS